MFSRIRQFLLPAFMLLWASCADNNSGSQQGETKGQDGKAARIVSISGTTTEILCALGMESNIIGVDVTSTYPESMAALPKVGHNRNMSAEAIVALKPDWVVGLNENIKPELIEQLKSAGVRVMLFDRTLSVEGTKALVRAVADSVQHTAEAQACIDAIDKDIASKTALPSKPKVLFIYARGAGTLMVGGNNTPAQAIIEAAGGENAVNDFEDFKPLTPEALLKANPDAILLFDSGLESLGGEDGLLKVPGVAATKAGKSKNFIQMDGQLLTGFGPRVGKAIGILSQKLNEIK